MPSNLSPSSQWTHLMGKGQSCHGDPQGIRHHRSRGLKMCLCNSKHTLCTDTNRDRRNKRRKGTWERSEKTSKGSSSNRGWNAQWRSGVKRGESCMTALPKGRLEASDEMFIPGRSTAGVSSWWAGGKHSWVELEWLGKTKPWTKH